MLSLILSAITPQTAFTALQVADSFAETESYAPAPVAPRAAAARPNKYAALKEPAPHHPTTNLGRRFRHAQYARLAA
ncbi:MAG: hypothetical protein PHY92_02340 [Alphaproteobacteria bacterium]|nr:hypothetical protein [Alphaproteobacteria bacterium]